MNKICFRDGGKIIYQVTKNVCEDLVTHLD